ncbi:MAG: alpha/beta hydrolase family protein [Isosphaeraceae bacterium]
MMSARAIAWFLVAGSVLAASLNPRCAADDEAIRAADLRVLDRAGTAEYPAPRSMLNAYLMARAREQFDARRQVVAAIKTPEDVAARQQSMRKFVRDALGDLPERTPLNPQVVGTLRRDGYRIEKVIFESRPRHHVTANLYIPDGKPPFPGVLLPCGHSDDGKAYESYQRAAILLARNGMAVLCYDPIGQGERMQRLDEKGRPVIRGTTEHTMAGIGALLVGREEASYCVWDGIRTLDYLAGRPEVDPRRLGCTGNSGGGTMTAYLMALDDRIAVAAPSCYLTSLERLFATSGPQDAEQNITGQVAAGLEHADFVTMRAPQPTLMVVGTRDFFDIQGSWDTFREVKLIFGRLGFGERGDLFESDEPHGFTRPRRIAAARWMSRWLLKKDEPIDEPDSSIASVADLRCTQSGQVLRELSDRSVFDLNAERARELRSVREASGARKDDEALRAEVRRLLGLGKRPIAPSLPREVGTINVRGRQIRKLIFHVERGIVVPALDIPAIAEDRPARVLVKVGVNWAREGAIDDLLKVPGRVVLINPRGLGETDPGAANRRDWPFGGDWKEAFLALHLNRPLLGMRVVDLLAVIDGLHAEQEEPAGYHLVGVAVAGPVVLHAAFLDEKNLIREVTLERSIRSWEDVVIGGLSRGQLGNVVPGVLAVYDLPDLAARLARRPVKLIEPVDASGNPLPGSPR